MTRGMPAADRALSGPSPTGTRLFEDAINESRTCAGFRHAGNRL